MPGLSAVGTLKKEKTKKISRRKTKQKKWRYKIRFRLIKKHSVFTALPQRRGFFLPTAAI